MGSLEAMRGGKSKDRYFQAGPGRHQARARRHRRPRSVQRRRRVDDPSARRRPASRHGLRRRSRPRRAYAARLASCASRRPGSARATSTTSSMTKEPPNYAGLTHRQHDRHPRLRQPVHPADRPPRFARRKVYCEIHPFNLSAEKLRSARAVGGHPLGRAGQRLRRGRAAAVAGRPRSRTCRCSASATAWASSAMADGGVTARSDHREYGQRRPRPVDGRRRPFRRLRAQARPTHGLDEPRRPAREAARQAGSRSRAAATRRSRPCAAATAGAGRVQFHPEVVHSRTRPRRSSRTSCSASATLRADWTMESYVDHGHAAHPRDRSATRQVVCGISGGVDSTVTAALIEKAVPGQLTCVFVDNGLLRKNEAARGPRACSALTSARTSCIVDAARALSRRAGRRRGPGAKAQDHRPRLHRRLRGRRRRRRRTEPRTREFLGAGNALSRRHRVGVGQRPVGRRSRATTTSAAFPSA